MKQPVFLQPYDIDNGPTDFSGMVCDWYDLHEQFCDEHNYQFYTDRDCYPAEDWLWNKIFMIRNYLRENLYSHIFWMDADIIVARLDIDLRLALPSGKWLGLVSHHSGGWNGIGSSHWNTGVMYVRQCPEALAFFEEACAWKSRPHTWQNDDEQSAVQKLILENFNNCQAGFQELDHKWNANYNFNQFNPAETIIMGFHGAGNGNERRQIMLDFGKEKGWI